MKAIVVTDREHSAILECMNDRIADSRGTSDLEPEELQSLYRKMLEAK
jgi:hypothetical protein